jgi:hypothetical protein
MDELLLKQKKVKQQEFEQNLLSEQEAFQEADIEASRERDRLQKEGDEAQEELAQQESDNQDENIRQQEFEIELQQEDQEYEQQQIDAQQQEDLGPNDSSEDEAPEEASSVQASTRPKFPGIFLSICVVKDFLDIVLDLTGVGALLVSIYNFFFNGVYYVWRKWRGGRLNVSDTKKSLLASKTTIRMAAMFGVEIIPFVGMLPLTSLSVIHYYREEVKTWKEDQKEKLLKKNTRTKK